ncbi:MAG: hypothetical protein HLUCCA01_10515 [Bacteroidetes bacterium HLUCCA01]|nr:MAG: hypothetical protein HLUCCA01_10515 [Bacteroidetes bacterium HLUCCA01]
MKTPSKPYTDQHQSFDQRMRCGNLSKLLGSAAEIPIPPDLEDDILMKMTQVYPEFGAAATPGTAPESTGMASEPARALSGPLYAASDTMRIETPITKDITEQTIAATSPHKNRPLVLVASVFLLIGVISGISLTLILQQMNFSVLGIPGEWLTPVIQMVAAVVILTQFNTFVRYTRDVFPDSIFSRLK